MQLLSSADQLSLSPSLRAALVRGAAPWRRTAAGAYCRSVAPLAALAGMLAPAALAACSLADGPSVLQPHPSPLGAEEETARRFDSAKCRRMLERVQARLSDMENTTRDTLKEEIKRAVEFEYELAEMTREEADLLGAYLQRDLEHLLHFVEETGEGLKKKLPFLIVIKIYYFINLDPTKKNKF